MAFRDDLDERCGATIAVDGSAMRATCTRPPEHDGDHIDEIFEPSVDPWPACAGRVGGRPCLLPAEHEGDCRRH